MSHRWDLSSCGVPAAATKFKKVKEQNIEIRGRRIQKRRSQRGELEYRNRKIGKKVRENN